MWLKIKKYFPQPKVAQWIMDNFNSAEAFLGSPKTELTKKGWPDPLLGKFFAAKKFNENHFIAQLDNKNLRLMCIEDEHYPLLLKAIKDPPASFFYRGNIANLGQKTVSIVGSRKCSERGKSLASKISRILAENGYTVVSGLANGIDSAAHIGALETGQTTAVLGCGLDMCYPASNKHLFDRIANAGCLVSEFFWGEKPLKHHFPYRNRIISGLSSFLIVIEAGQKSGAIITANLALEHGREVLAIPGGPFDSYSKGCNQLIKDGAFLLDDIEELKHFFDVELKRNTEAANDPFIEMMKQKPRTLEELSQLTKSSSPKLLAKITELEIQKIISRDENNRFFVLS